MGNAFHLGYWMLPPELLIPVVVMLVALGLPLWWLGARRIGRFLSGIALLLLLLEFAIVPLFVEMLGHVPLWVLLLLLIYIASWFIRAVLSLFLGREVVGPLLARGIAFGLNRLLHMHWPVGQLVRRFKGLLLSHSLIKKFLALSLLLVLASCSGFSMRQCVDPMTSHPTSLVSGDEAKHGYEVVVVSWEGQPIR